eukprot:TRINITY_DN31191_c0_g1_i1.p1 TRINITY_DN31191_c0_g1~~TRINITY_DN31191_c0_g1_i1.p1  ORF type:complete len:308 (+),score=11.42 TRINITY_DN31191_c0_g1_i1:114-1037(+)
MSTSSSSNGQTSSAQSEIENNSTTFYIICGVIAGIVLLVLIIVVICKRMSLRSKVTQDPPTLEPQSPTHVKNKMSHDQGLLVDPGASTRNSGSSIPSPMPSPQTNRPTMTSRFSEDESLPRRRTSDPIKLIDLLSQSDDLEDIGTLMMMKKGGMYNFMPRRRSAFALGGISNDTMDVGTLRELVREELSRSGYLREHEEKTVVDDLKTIVNGVKSVLGTGEPRRAVDNLAVQSNLQPSIMSDHLRHNEGDLEQSKDDVDRSILAPSKPKKKADSERDKHSYIWEFIDIKNLYEKDLIRPMDEVQEDP